MLTQGCHGISLLLHLPARVSNNFERTRTVAQVVESMVQLHHTKRIPYGEMAVIYRNHVLSQAVERELKRRRIKYVLLSGTSLFDREEARGVRARVCSISVSCC